MFLMNYLFGFVLVFVAFSVVSLGMAVAPYQGVIALMGISFFCCVLMVLWGRTFVALMMYIVYLGGLIVVFGYCVSIEKDKGNVLEFDGLKHVIAFFIISVFCMCDSLGGLLVYPNWEELLCMEVNGGGVFYYLGGAGLLVCSWGLLVVLFSILIILSWGRLGGLRPF
uniref:NADH dehydrogenase subunit 6 n=1 Tax=Emydocephalus annulatus TaxID=355678 RepID=A0A6B9PAC1_9SAUR|nr:NADH dehydrogenase subunit 6 [Emydocephalus ijimae]QHD48179.1 NADH dehydrogenase subunit 6 [Emydocephalus ijimae]BDB03960.1 NADH dehydrogenase subunit 6 [Emydocephalus ijimae]